MSARNASCAALASGILALWMGLTDTMLKYLKPSMRPWLVLAGVALAGLGLYGLVRARRTAVVHATGGDGQDHADGPDDHDDGHGRPRIGWLLLVPIVVLIAVGQQPLGSYAAGRASARSLPPYSFDIAGYAHDRGEDAPRLQILDVYLGVDQRANRDYLLRHDVRLVGFVTHDGAPAASGAFVLNRFLISCCAADASRLSVGVAGARSVPSDNTWVEVRARLDAVRPPVGSNPKAIFTVRSIRHVAAPSNPYEGLR